MYALQSPGNFAEQFYGLVNKAYAASGGKAVHIISHSYGGPIVLNFMNNYLPAGMTRAQFDQWVQDKVKRKLRDRFRML
jgi:alpha-beta hydrolase superfamily lysophospholipase